jgi:hypothetical protein
MLEPMHSVSDTGTSYASVIEEMHSMYLLSFLLTADHDKAEQCLLSTIGEGPEGIGVFVDWTRLWARRAVIKQAIDLIVPAPEHADDVSRISLTEPARWADNIPFAAILLLDAFERFVLVMSILEGQSDEECAIEVASSCRCYRDIHLKLRHLTHREIGESRQLAKFVSVGRCSDGSYLIVDILRNSDQVRRTYKAEENQVRKCSSCPPRGQWF